MVELYGYYRTRVLEAAATVISGHEEIKCNLSADLTRFRTGLVLKLGANKPWANCADDGCSRGSIKVIISSRFIVEIAVCLGPLQKTARWAFD